jgi:hypothetical protein
MLSAVIEKLVLNATIFRADYTGNAWRTVCGFDDEKMCFQFLNNREQQKNIQ